MKIYKPSKDEIRMYGINVCRMIFTNRAQDIRCVYLTQDLLKLFGELLKILAKNKRPYHVVSNEELNLISESMHHQGICIFAKRIHAIGLQDYLKMKKNSPIQLLLAFDQIGNPHNVGAILRSAAHYGVDGVLLEKTSLADSSAAIKASSGGREFVTIIQSQNLKDDLKRLHGEGHSIVTTSSHAKKSHLDMGWSKKTVILLGEEEQGIAPELLELGSQICIQGTGHVESLNVSVASALLCQEFRRKHPLS